MLLLGPFNCLPFRISEAILKPLCVHRNTPNLTYESDGYAVSAGSLRQVEVHISKSSNTRLGTGSRNSATAGVPG